MNYIFKPTGHPNNKTRNILSQTESTFSKTNHGQEALSYLAPIVWNRLPNSLKVKEGINIHKHSVKNIA